VSRRRLAAVGRAFRSQGAWRVWLSDTGRVWATGPGYAPGLQCTLTADEPSKIGEVIRQWEQATSRARKARAGP
jgi:hypothetical protein